MSKYTEKLAEKIVSLIEEDTYSISEICSTLNISRKSFYQWRDRKPEFKKAIDRAIENRDDKLMIMARNSLKKKLVGYTLTEIRTTYIPDKENPEKLILKTQVVKQKEYAPDTHAIKLTLSRNEGKTDTETDTPSALTIIVQDPKTAEQLNLLHKNQMNSVPKEKKEYEAEIAQQELPANEPSPDNKEDVSPVPEKKSRYVVKSIASRTVPPGYRYRGYK